MKRLGETKIVDFLFLLSPVGLRLIGMNSVNAYGYFIVFIEIGYE